MPEAMTFEMSDGASLRADHWASSSTCSTLLLHGGGQTRHSWKTTGSELARAGVDTYSIDARGHGDSDRSPGGVYSRARLAEDIVSIARSMDRPVVLVGASMGGLASLIASTRLEHELLAGLVLVDVVPRYEVAGAQRVFDFMSAHPDGFASLDDAAEAISEYLPQRPRKDVRAGLSKNLQRRDDGRWHWHWDPAFLVAAQGLGGGAVRDDDVLDAAARQLTAPTLLVRGMLSDVVSEQAATEFLDSVPRARIVELSGAAHTAAADDNTAFTAAVLHFINHDIDVNVVRQPTPRSRPSQ